MKNLFLLLFFFCTLSCSQSIESEYKGSVKTIQTTIYSADSNFGEISKGDITDFTSFNFDFNRDFNRDFDYLFWFGSESIYSMNHKLQFNQDGQLLEAELYDKNGGKEYTLRQEFDGGALIKKMVTSPTNSDVFLNLIFEYDSNGELILIQNTRDINKIDSIEVHRDKNTINYYCTGYCQKRESLLIELNSDGLASKIYDGRNSEILYSYEYDNSGNILKKEEFDGGDIEKVQFIAICQYNERNNISYTEFKRYKVAFDYKYDDIGNWVEKIITLDDEPYQIVERNIEYY